ncbi:MAG: IS200/IS605 family transposase [Bacteroidota bacterium]
MPKYRKLIQCIYHCTYHIVWTPKYRYRVLEGKIAEIIERKIRQLCEWHSVEIAEMNVQVDHVHMLVSIPPKLSVSKFMGVLKGKTAIHIFEKKRYLREKPFWGNHFWARGYFVSTVGLDEEMVKRYVEHQEKEGKRSEDDNKNYKLF